MHWKDNPESTPHDLRVATMGQVVWVPLTKVRTVYGLAMTPEQHPFVRYLRDGFPSLLRFYQLHQPTSLFELFFLQAEDVVALEDSSSVRTWPWAPRSSFFLAGGTPPNKWFGPAERGFVLQVAKRIDTVVKSIQKKGFVTSGFDPPSYFLLSLDTSSGLRDYRVVLNGGNHRVAVLSHLGWERVPLTVLPYFVAPEVRLSEIDRWPGVVDGTFSPESAEKLFMSFFRGDREILIDYW